MIPKIIHYCWFGGKPLPEDVKRYISTWHTWCPDYKIQRWDEHNFDITQNQYCKEAYEAKKWAFVTDYVRLKVLYEYGGFYMDTDVEVCRSLNDLRQYNALSGFESKTRIQTGTMGACQNSDWISFLLTYYDQAHFKLEDGSYNLITNVETITKMTTAKYNIRLDGSFQIFGDNNVLFPFEVLCAKNLTTGKIVKTDNTYTIHHFAGSWVSPVGKIRHKVKNILAMIIGETMTDKLSDIYKMYK